MIENLRPIAPPVRQRRRQGLYLFLVAAQTAGAAIVLVNGVPIYRQLVRDFSKHEPEPGILWWAVAAVALIQFAYWLRVWLQPSLPQSRHVVIGHLAYFVARLSFVFTSSTFAVVFLARYDQLNPSLPRTLVVLAMLFSLFCYTLELERLAKALHGTEGKP